MTFRNLILKALPADEVDDVARNLTAVELEQRNVLFEPNRTIENVYFFETGVGSIINLLADGTAVETATVGYEGMMGLPVYLGAGAMPSQAFVQVSGTGYRMPAAALREEVRRGRTLAVMLGRYTQAVFTMLAQSVACNRKHTLDKRCARWMLHTHDRVGADEFGLTQEFLSQMLGVRRASVSEAASELQAKNFINYSRGRVSVTDRAGLEGSSCECYHIIQGEFSRLLGGKLQPNPLEGLKTSEDGKATVGDGGGGDGDTIR